MDRERVDRLLKYALLYAGELGYGFNELREIHLIKYVYLADLEYAARHEGKTFTGASWKFHHYGPWDLQVYARIPAAAAQLGIVAEEREAKSGREYVAYGAHDSEKLADLDRQLPYEVVSSIKRYVKEHGSDTPGLLSLVYRTAPMRHAAPEEPLDFRTAIQPIARAPEVTPAPISRNQEKKLEQQRQAFRESFNKKLEEKLAAKAARKKAEGFVPPRYDDVYRRGTAWLDSLAGEPLTDVHGEAVVDDSIWKSQARTDGERS